MSDISVRIPINNFRTQYLESNAINKLLLSGITDTMYKPVGVEIKNYHPKLICMRMRESFGQASTLTEIKTLRSVDGYSDEKMTLAEGTTKELKDKMQEMKYESWGVMIVSSAEFTLPNGKNLVSVLHQEIKPVGKFLKIEAPTADALRNCLKALRAESTEIINNNAAVLLAGKLGLI